MSGQNTSSAVMQQRSEARDALDDFPTPPWATRALCDWLKSRGNQLENCVVREPCANRGYMVGPLQEAFASVDAADVHDYGAGYPIRDYLFGEIPDKVEWTIKNPPFRLAQQFIERALRSSSRGIAVFCRMAFLEGQERHNTLFAKTPPSAILRFAERVVIHKGVMREPGSRYWDASANDGEGKYRNASSATAYVWLVWEADRIVADDPAGHTAEFVFLPPCRAKFERTGDYVTRGADA